MRIESTVEAILDRLVTKKGLFVLLTLVFLGTLAAGVGTL